LYEDDGQSLQYQQGNYAITKINVADAGNDCTLEIYRPEGKFVPVKHSYLAKIHMTTVPKTVSIDNKGLAAVTREQLNTETGWYYDAQERVCWVNAGTVNIADNLAKAGYKKIVIFKN
jgi:hypothetical protein